MWHAVLWAPSPEHVHMRKRNWGVEEWMHVVHGIILTWGLCNIMINIHWHLINSSWESVYRQLDVWHRSQDNRPSCTFFSSLSVPSAVFTCQECGINQSSASPSVWNLFADWHGKCKLGMLSNTCLANTFTSSSSGMSQTTAITAVYWVLRFPSPLLWIWCYCSKNC